MKEVVSTSAVFFSYALLAIFAQNAVFTRALGVSRMVQLVGDDRTSSALFGMMLCITQVLVAPVAFIAGGFIAPLDNRAQLRPLVYIASYLQMTPETLSRVRNASTQQAKPTPRDQNDAWWTHTTELKDKG